MELLRGSNLEDAVRDGGPWSPEHTAALGLRLLAALSVAHERASSTATSSPPTSCSPRTAGPSSPTSASRQDRRPGHDDRVGTADRLPRLHRPRTAARRARRAGVRPVVPRRHPLRHGLRRTVPVPQTGDGPRRCTRWRTRSPSCPSGSARCARSRGAAAQVPGRASFRRPVHVPRCGASRRGRWTPDRCPRRPCACAPACGLVDRRRHRDQRPASGPSRPGRPCSHGAAHHVAHALAHPPRPGRGAEAAAWALAGTAVLSAGVVRRAVPRRGAAVQGGPDDEDDRQSGRQSTATAGSR